MNTHATIGGGAVDCFTTILLRRDSLFSLCSLDNVCLNRYDVIVVYTALLRWRTDELNFIVKIIYFCLGYFDPVAQFDTFDNEFPLKEEMQFLYSMKRRIYIQRMESVSTQFNDTF